MTFFRPSGFVDTFNMVAQLHRLIALPSTVFPLAVGSDWKSGRRLIGAVVSVVSPNLIVDHAEVVQLLPGRLGWKLPREDNGLHFVVPLVTNPYVLFYRRHESLQAGAGVVVWIDYKQAGTEVNWGPSPAYLLALYGHADTAMGESS